jgi:hypothetical protein
VVKKSNGRNHFHSGSLINRIPVPCMSPLEWLLYRSQWPLISTRSSLRQKELDVHCHIPKNPLVVKRSCEIFGNLLNFYGEHLLPPCSLVTKPDSVLSAGCLPVLPTRSHSQYLKVASSIRNLRTRLMYDCWLLRHDYEVFISKKRALCMIVGTWDMITRYSSQSKCVSDDGDDVYDNNKNHNSVNNNVRLVQNFYEKSKSLYFSAVSLHHHYHN